MFDRAAYYREKRAEEFARRPDTYCAGGCGEMLPKKPRGRRWCSMKCRNTVHNQHRRAARAVGRVERHPLTKYIYEALEDTEPGLCPWCDEPLPQGRKVNCGDVECTRAYRRAYRTARCETERAGRLLQRILCACGCGNPLQQDRLQRKYIDERHYADYRSRMQREKRAENRKPRSRPSASPGARAFLFGKAMGPKVLAPFPRQA